MNEFELPTVAEGDLLADYNYESFTPRHYEPWMRFDQSPPLGERAPSLPLQRLDDREDVQLGQLWKQHLYTIVEFGSFT